MRNTHSIQSNHFFFKSRKHIIHLALYSATFNVSHYLVSKFHVAKFCNMDKKVLYLNECCVCLYNDS